MKKKKSKVLTVKDFVDWWITETDLAIKEWQCLLQNDDQYQQVEYCPPQAGSLNEGRTPTVWGLIPELLSISGWFSLAPEIYINSSDPFDAASINWGDIQTLPWGVVVPFRQPEFSVCNSVVLTKSIYNDIMFLSICNVS